MNQKDVASLTKQQFLSLLCYSVSVLAQLTGLSPNVFYYYAYRCGISWQSKEYSKIAHMHRIAKEKHFSTDIIQFIELIASILRTVANFSLYDIFPGLKTEKSSDAHYFIFLTPEKITEAKINLHKKNINIFYTLPFLASRRLSSQKKNKYGSKQICYSDGIHEEHDTVETIKEIMNQKPINQCELIPFLKERFANHPLARNQVLSISVQYDYTFMLAPLDEYESNDMDISD